MCGIALLFNESDSENYKIKEIIKKINHRGPDDEGYFHDTNLEIGSCRLSILDLSDKGHMPLFDKSGRYVISYNGEIYNYLELKKKFNIETKSSSDTEVLIELYKLLNKKMLDYLNGIFSFIIYDKQKKEIFCARDRLGVKPMYYFKNKNMLIISSEIKGVLDFKNQIELNKKAINTYINTSFYDIGKNTFYKNIFQLEQSSYLEFNLENKVFNISRYWNIQKKNVTKKNDRELQDKLKKLIDNAFTLQIRTDTNLGVNVSGGIDSKLMMLKLNEINGGQKNIQANSFYFDDYEFSEKKEVEKFISKIGWKVNFYKITPDDVIENFDKVFNSQDEPFPGVPTIGKDLLIKRAYKEDCKVILEGQGGDDFAGGYKYIQPFYIKSLLKNFKIKEAYQEVKSFMKIEELNFNSFLKFYFSCLKNIKGENLSADGTSIYDKSILNNNNNKNDIDLYKDVLKKIKDFESPLKKIIHRDLFYCKLPRILRSCDRSSMAHGKELRVPLLDHNIVEFFLNLNEKRIIYKGNLRYFYRNFISNYFPLIEKNDIFQRKKYVSDPQTKWMKNELFEWALSILSSKRFNEMNIYDQKKLVNLFKEFKFNNRMNNSNIFWQALCLYKLYERV